MLALLATYQHTSMVILPLLGILWGMVYMRWRQESKLVPAVYMYEAFIVRRVGRPLWKRMYQHLVF